MRHDATRLLARATGLPPRLAAGVQLAAGGMSYGCAERRLGLGRGHVWHAVQELRRAG